MFEVGKKYKGVNTGIIFTCVWANNKQATLTSDISGMAILVEWDRSGPYYKEYIEPRKEYYNAYKDSKGVVTYSNPYDDVKTADAVARGYLDYYGRLIMTHHSETHVDVEFHLKRK